MTHNSQPTAYRMAVDGTPRPQGSMRIVAPRRMTSDNPKLKAWRRQVAAAADEHRAGQPLLDGPLAITVDFYLPRPAGHYGTGRNTGLVRALAKLLRPVTKPDLDKLLRAIGDALTGTWIVDDARIVEVHARKWYADPADGPGCIVEVHKLPVEEAAA